MAGRSRCRSSAAPSTRRPCCAWRARTSAPPTGGGPRRGGELLGVVEDDAERVAQAARDTAHAVAHRGAVDAASPLHRAVSGREDDDLALLGGDRFAARLRPRPLLDQQEIPALVVDAAA